MIKLIHPSLGSAVGHGSTVPGEAPPAPVPSAGDRCETVKAEHKN